jgi:hypothetical protein
MRTNANPPPSDQQTPPIICTIAEGGSNLIRLSHGAPALLHIAARVNAHGIINVRLLVLVFLLPVRARH